MKLNIINSYIWAHGDLNQNREGRCGWVSNFTGRSQMIVQKLKASEYFCSYKADSTSITGSLIGSYRNKNEVKSAFTPHL